MGGGAITYFAAQSSSEIEVLAAALGGPADASSTLSWYGGHPCGKRPWRAPQARRRVFGTAVPRATP